MLNPFLMALHAERHGGVALAAAGWVHEEHVVGLAHEGACGQTPRGITRYPSS